MQSQKQTFTLVVVILACFVAIIALSRYIDAKRSTVDATLEEEKLYVTGAAAKRMSLSFNGLVADWYWMRSLQYVGNKMVNFQGSVQLDDLQPLNLNLLYPLLDNAATLDPKFMSVYEYGAVILPTINKENAIKLIKKGISSNPDAWQLYHQLGFIYWKSGDFKLASEAYMQGSKISSAPSWMKFMSARLEAEGGSRDVAYAMFRAMFEQADDPNVQELAARRLLQIESFDEREAIKKAMLEYRQKNKVCPSTWRDIGIELKSAMVPDRRVSQLNTVPASKPLRLDTDGAPLDPSDTAYLIQTGCNVDLNWQKSKVPYR